jgi:4,5-DOPA dioxygenase extradiol
VVPSAAVRRPAPSRAPAAFVSAADQADLSSALGQLGATLPRPRAVIAISGEWITPDKPLTTAARVSPTSEYPAPGWPQLAHRVAEALGGGVDRERGLDPAVARALRLLFPLRDVRAIQLSVPRPASPAGLVAIGRALAAFRDEGVLVLGTGGVVRNRAFRDWMAERIVQLDLTHLLEYRREAPFAAAAVPSESTLLPLFAVVGSARPGDRVRSHMDGYTAFALSQS